MRSVVFACLWACGGATSSHPNVVPLPSATSVATKPEVRGPSSAVAKLFTVSSPTEVVYADIEGLARSKLASALLPQISALLKPRDAAAARCVEGATAGAKELLFGAAARGSGWLAVVRLDGSRFSPSDCTDRFLTAGTTSATPSPDIVVVGTRALVDEALRGGGHAPTGLDLQRGEYLRLLDVNPDVRATLTLTDERFAIHVDADLAEGVAQNIETMFEGQMRSPRVDSSEDDRQTIARLFRASKLTRRGGHLSYALVFDEGVADQARDLGTTAAVAIHAIDKYLRESKKAEAKNAVSAITRSVIESWEREDLPPVPPSKKKLRSFLPVPNAVPRGTAYVSAHSDWAAWSPLRFEIMDAQRYQYEVRAAPDGMSADVIARGDLNGDGKTSLFVVHVTVNKTDRTLKISDLVETDPDE